MLFIFCPIHHCRLFCKVEQHPCPSPDLYPLAQGGNCKPFGRLHVNLDESDELGTFIFRNTGFNSIRTLAARLRYYHAASNGLLSCLPLQLTLRGKSTMQSYRTPVYYEDLTLRDGISLKDERCHLHGERSRSTE